ncbi:MBL fold metallo-hydrolase [Acetobacter sacchari]|uniref:MBL fold metallo-hydrolase n=1 Tax=Acetobacter sacchari TaxID=2661687 RepID=A0ABS3LWT6_9PROT|nr:MBL fold metallo-hydrolase [Acetobacter sacchari]MBO1360382.1 MBL fold metallo-hydrolase [Acetobacter sacchari]
MSITVLGCGGSSGVPQIGGPDGRGEWGSCDPAEPRNRRTRSSIVLAGPDGRRILVDTGPDLRAQLLATGIGGIDAIFYTHAHADHIAGLDDVRPLNWAAGRAIEAFGTSETLEEVRTRFDYAFRPWTTKDFFRPGVVARPIMAGQVLDIAGLSLTVFEQDHGKLNSLGFRCGSFAYCTDVASFTDDVLTLLEDVDTWMVDCFQLKPHSAHGWLERVVEWAGRIRPRRTILTHLGTAMDWAWMQRELPSGIEAAFDGMTFSVEGGALSPSPSPSSDAE